jgi:L-threonylcarbamoyladenylate synthase
MVQASARVLSALQSADLARAAVILIRGGIVALPFNGMFALFGDLEQPHVHERIMAAKNRQHDKRLAQVCLPEHANELVDFSQTPRPERDVIALWQEVHSLGMILPANRRDIAARERVQPSDGTTLLVWTEYPPLRRVLEQFRALGGKALLASSANRSGQPTATTTREVWREFFTEIDAIVADEFSHLPAQRRQSTTIVDLTSAQPRLHRPGSVTPVELQTALALHGFGPLQVGTVNGARRVVQTTSSIRVPSLV